MLKTGLQGGSSNLGEIWKEVFLSGLLEQVQVIGSCIFSSLILPDSRWFSLARLKLSLLRPIDLCFCDKPSEKQQAMTFVARRMLLTTIKITNSSM